MDIFDRNNLPLGLGIGVLSPVIGYLLVYGIFALMVSAGMMDPAGSAGGKRLRTIFIIAICTNVFWVRKFNQPHTAKTLRGIVLATMGYSIVWFVKYYQELYAE